MEIRSLDGISGPGGECTCDHCQLEHNIDGIIAANQLEDKYAKSTVAVVSQVE